MEPWPSASAWSCPNSKALNTPRSKQSPRNRSLECVERGHPPKKTLNSKPEVGDSKTEVPSRNHISVLPDSCSSLFLKELCLGAGLRGFETWVAGFHSDA